MPVMKLSMTILEQQLSDPVIRAHYDALIANMKPHLEPSLVVKIYIQAEPQVTRRLTMVRILMPTQKRWMLAEHPGYPRTGKTPTIYLIIMF